MKINAVISKSSVNVDSTYKSAIISAITIAVGIIFGAIICILSKDNLNLSLIEYFINFSTDFSNKNKPEILSGIILSHIPYFIMMIIFGTSVVGTPAVILLTNIKSMGIGLLTTYIYSSFSLKGIEYCLLVMFPGKFVLIFAMILLTQSCFVTSNDVRHCLTNKEGRVVSLEKFAIRSILIFGLIILSALIDFLAIISFSSLFNFT